MCVNEGVRSDTDLLLSVVQESSDSSNTTIEDEDVKGERCLFLLHFLKAIRRKSPCIHSDFTFFLMTTSSPFHNLVNS